VKGTQQKAGRMRGFTLLEMMVVLVIAGLLFALTPPLFTGAVSGTRLKGLARDLVTMMRETRSQAIIRNAEQQMYLDTEARHYRAGDNRVLHLPEGVTMTVQPATAPDDPAQQQHVLRFFPDGSSSGAKISVSGGNHGYYLQLDWLTGRVTISEGPHDDG